MLRGPRGEKRAADVIGDAVKVMRIATAEETEERDPGGASYCGGGTPNAAPGAVLFGQSSVFA